MADWPTVRIPREMMNKVEEFIETDHAKEIGFTNKSQVVVAAVRLFLKTERRLKFSLRSKKYDRLLPFEKIGLLIFCELCNSLDCEHANHLLKHSALFSWESLREGVTLAEAPKFYE